MRAPITVCIATYGPDRQHWSNLAHERAMASVDRQTLQPENLRWTHGDSLADARNRAAMAADSDWLCFLDADDELDPHYLEAMTKAIGSLQGDWLLQPATLGVHPDGREDPEPVVIPTKALIDGNYMVIGTLIRTAQFHRLGGFGDWPYAEDWELWLRSWIDGAHLQAVPEAIYRVHVNGTGRNSCPRALQVATYNAIRQKHFAGAAERARIGP